MIVTMLFIFLLLQIADCITTVYILKQGGREANPFMNWLFGKLGVSATLAIMKTVAVIAVVLVWDDWLTLGLTVFYAGVVGWNGWQIVKSK